MAPCPPVSTSLASLLSGLILCLPILLFHVLFLIMMLFFLVSLFLNPFPVVLADGWWVRSRIKWAEGGATSTRFFLRMEEKWAAESWISAMRVSNVVVRDFDTICEPWDSFYKDLFTASPVDLEVLSGLLNCLSLSLSVDDADSCDDPVSSNGAHAALLGIAKGKSPGSDGLPMEFYVVFWKLLSGDLVDVFNASLETGLLPFFQREALIDFQEG